MKRCLVLFSCLICICVLHSCKRKKEDKSEQIAAKKITRRSTFITKENSYSDFFFDSLKLVSFINEQQAPDSLSTRLTSFYNSRNYQFAWFSSSGLTEEGRGFWNMYKYYLSFETDKADKDSAFVKEMDKYAASDREDWTATQNNLVQAELKMSSHYLQFFFSNVAKGYLKRKEIERFIPAQKKNAVSLADSMVNKKHKDDRYYGDVNKTYGGLRTHLAKYVEIQKKGGWPVVTGNASDYRETAVDSRIVILKRRLQLSGELPATDTSMQYTPMLTEAIRKFQHKHGYKETGEISDVLLKDMNVPVEQRIAQLIMNMGRSQWVIDQPAGKFILVNIPEFLMHVTNQGNKVFDMVVVVGKEGHNTTVFTGKLNQVVFAPYWNVPASIVEKEIVPSIEKDPNYLQKQNMEINGKLAGGLPAVRQLPGEKNSLGLVKFLFPNSYDIYFHDTPSKSLFDKEKRAFSHGCIRLSEPAKMAEWLLKDDAEWSKEKIAEAMHGGDEKTVRIKSAVPVLITYYTAWIEPDGALRFADDIYGHDASMMKKMFLDN